MKRRIRFLLVPLLVAVLVAVTAGADTHYRQSPMLDPAVAAGELPPVAERLPDNPLVVTPIEEIGTYGGTINLEGVGSSLGADILHVSSPETLLGFDLDGKTVIQSLAESWEYSEGFDGIHRASARGGPLVGRRSVRRGRPAVLVRATWRSTKNYRRPSPDG